MKTHALLTLFTVALGACGGDSNEVSPGPVVPATDATIPADGNTGGSDGDGGTQAGGTGGAGGQTGGAGGQAGGATADAGPVGGDGGSRPPDAGPDPDDGVPPPDAGPEPDAFDPTQCVGEAECWSCPPTEQTHFLNRCTTSDCAPFDNAARLPLLADPLPPLP